MSGPSTLRVGVVSDTHGLLRPEAVDALRGSDLIVHAGDVGDPAILERLAALAPVHAVRGNVDHGAWAVQLPRTLLLEAGGVSLYVLHDLAELDLDPGAAGVDILVYGHSHRPEIRDRGGVTYLNPGSAGPRRLSLPVTVAVVEVTGGVAAARLIELL